MKSYVAVLKKGIMDFIPNQQFRIMVSHFFAKSINIPKRIYLELGVEVPFRIVEFPADEEIDTVNEINH